MILYGFFNIELSYWMRAEDSNGYFGQVMASTTFGFAEKIKKTFRVPEKWDVREIPLSELCVLFKEEVINN